jgi:hypothetical protein
MKVSFPQQEDPHTEGTTPDRRRRRLLAGAVGAFILLLLFFALLQPERLQRGVAGFEERWGGTVYEYDRSLAEKWSLLIGSFFRSRIDDLPDVPEIVIDVPFKEISRIYRKRQEALAIGHLVQAADDFVKADIRLAGRNVPVKLRLKGDWIDHLQGRKWSFRIRVRSGDHLLGMRRFSIQNPATRGFQAEKMYFELLGGLSLMTPRYQFVNVTLNGEPMGLMALEEFFAKELLEFHRRREGVIVRFDESLVWNSRDSLAGDPVGWNGSFDDYRNAAIDAIGSTKISESAALSEQYRVAQGLLKGFADGRLRASQVFDVQQLGRFIAASDVMGAWHATRWANLRFYLNPVTLKLEPIPFDATLQEAFFDARSIVNSEPILLDMLRDPLVWEEYLATLELLLNLAREGVLQENLRAVEREWLDLLQTEFRLLGPFPLDYLLPRSEALYAGMSNLAASGSVNLAYFLPFEHGLYPVLAHFEIRTSSGKWLQIENAIPRDVTVIGIDWVNDSTGARQSAVVSALPIAVPPRGIGSMGQRLQTPLSASPGEGWVLETRTKISGRSWVSTTRPVDVEPALDASPLPVGDVDEQVARHAFLHLDAATHTLRIARGKWVVDANLVIPVGYVLRIEAGATLRFAQDAALISYGPVEMAGTESSPILLVADGTSWPGMVVLNAQGQSSLRHVTVAHTRSVSMPGWTLTGGANFYASDVRINNSQFLDSAGEDALNIIHSSFEIRDTLFEGTASDAFDADFSHGIVATSRFQNIGVAGGGDAIDVSGSILELESVEFVTISDKSLSVGERSEVTATHLDIAGTGTGVASKDGSLLTIRDSRIAAAGFAAMTAYIKKPEYGPARLVAENVSITGTDTPVVVQTGNQMTIDTIEVETQDVDVDALYETVMHPGLRN